MVDIKTLWKSIVFCKGENICSLSISHVVSRSKEFLNNKEIIEINLSLSHNFILLHKILARQINTVLFNFFFKAYKILSPLNGQHDYNTNTLYIPKYYSK